MRKDIDVIKGFIFKYFARYNKSLFYGEFKSPKNNFSDDDFSRV